ncbi:tripartite tricarboxylate transporter substrate binding protein [Afipia sp. GAS231]|uniref:Bug family tripartite tricarboxylate transporter substrate binding protein n=1 Tax=Afipia sp. GAS231 TaxID=1882747 RepID=UPI00087ACC6D|nr:tripartite tricarboxylate transporter substrate binding protein [Afipia sp. GAS231]SDO71134.1 Tripartite-type tricarboxylate transporter, receptor component TctC [Afipia sp. GAS231]
MGVQIRSVRVLACVLALITVAPIQPAKAQQYPSRPIKIIVPLAAGGVADIVARTVANALTQASKQPVVVENKPGGGGLLGAQSVANAQPDGYTLLMGFHGVIAVLPLLKSEFRHIDKELRPIIHIATIPNVLVVRPALQVRSVNELVAFAKANPGRLNYGSQGVGSAGHLSGEQIKQLAGIDMTHVPYRGAAPAVQDLIAGQIDLMFDTVALELPFIKDGTVRALAVTAPERLAILPELPTMSEEGYPGFRSSAWFGLFAPAGTPKPVMDWLNVTTRAAIETSEMRATLVAMGAQFPLGPTDQFEAFIADEKYRWEAVIKKARITLE